MIEKTGFNPIISNEISDILNADKFILPGVGSFDYGIQKLKALPSFDVFQKAIINDKKPVLGICLGMQLLGKSSEEGILPGLGWINMEFKKFRPQNKSLKVPHMGWNHTKNTQEPLFKGLHEGAKFYFVHSYYACCEDEKNIIAQANYGNSFVCAVQNKNIYGVQFHPEKSHKFGFQLLTNFCSL